MGSKETVEIDNKCHGCDEKCPLSIWNDQQKIQEIKAQGVRACNYYDVRNGGMFSPGSRICCLKDYEADKLERLRNLAHINEAVESDPVQVVYVQEKKVLLHNN
jgi:hypothetical protein